MGNFIYELSEGREIETIDDFFEFLSRNVRKGSFAYAYYTYPVRVNKTLGTKESPNKTPNPYFGRIFKHKPIEFRWEDTYAASMLRKDPDFEFKGGTTEYTPVEGVKIIKEGPNGLYFPVVPTGGGNNKSVYTVDDKIVDYSEIEPYLPKSSGYMPPTMSLLLDRVAGLSAGGAFWKNPDFKFKYVGQNAAKFQ